jgi:hypothetical protein
MVTKKKTYKVRRRIISKKRTKGGNKKQHSKKRRTKRTKNKIKGGVRGEEMRGEKRSREDEDEDEAKPEYERWTGEAISFVLVDLHGSYLKRPIITYDENQSYFTNASGLQRFLSADGNSYTSFEMNELVARDVVGENAVAGSGLRDDIIFWFLSRYTNSTPNINSHYIIKFILIQEWKTIFSGLKIMEQRYQSFYSEEQCLSSTSEEEYKIRKAQTFLETISEPFQIAAKQMIETYHKRIWNPCSGFGQSNSECSKMDLERTNSLPLHNAAFASCDLVPSGWYNRIQQFVKSCISNFFDKPSEYKKSKWHIGATEKSIESAYPRQTDVQIIETRKKELYGLSYKEESDRVITIFTKPDAVNYAYKTLDISHFVDEHDSKDDGIKNLFFTYRVFPEEPDKCIILIREAQFKAIQTYFVLPDRTEYIDSSSGTFEKHSIFFIDDINTILFKLFRLQTENTVSFYESCRGRPDAS